MDRQLEETSDTECFYTQTWKDTWRTASSISDFYTIIGSVAGKELRRLIEYTR